MYRFGGAAASAEISSPIGVAGKLLYGMVAMKVRGLLIAAIVLAAFLGALYWSNHHSSSADTTAKSVEDTPPKILFFDPPSATGLTIDRKDKPSLVLSRSSSGVWQITSPKPLAADQESVSSVITALSSLNADRLIEDKPANLSPFGLAAPVLELVVTLKDNKARKLLIGDQTPSGNAYYAMLDGDSRLFTLSSYIKSSLDKSSDDLRDKRLLTVDFENLSQVEVITHGQNKKQDITFARSKDAWQILRPGPFRAESSQVEDLIRSLKVAQMEIVPDSNEAKIAQAFSSAAPFAIAKVTGTSGTQELEIRKAKDECYAKSSALPGEYKVSATVATGLNKSLDDFRNKKVFDFGYDDPNKVEIHDGSKAYFLSRTGSDWWGPDGKKLDDSTVQSLLGNLRDLAATKFPQSGFNTPALVLIVASNDNKRVERVSVAKSGDNYIAKRENEAALYELSSAAITQLQESAAKLKTATPPKK